MANTKLNIPKTINVGYQTRTDTYTGKLAFVVYTDAKGVLRKEKSWNGWRDKKIEAETFENVPISGFVLNKKVGDYGGGWHSRKAWIRIYDPRNFEFEISVANLLFILEETSAIKGKGLEGEFVYAWDGADLVLLPAGSPEYKASSEFTDLQVKKVTKSDMKDGCLYLTKDQKQVMYLGRHDWFQLKTEYIDNGALKYILAEKQHVFVSVDGKASYWPQSGFTKLAAKLGEEPSPLFADEFEKFKASVNGSEPVELIGEPFKIPKDSYYHYGSIYWKNGNDFYPVWIERDYQADLFNVEKGKVPAALSQDKKIQLPQSAQRYYARKATTTRAELKAMGLYTLALKNKHGAIIPL